MRSFKTLIMGAAIFAATSSYAIVGLGFHWAPGWGSSVKASSGDVFDMDQGGTAQSASILQEKSDRNIGFGAKLWIDFLPFVDIEVSSMMQVFEYGLALDMQGDLLDTNIALEIETGLPGYEKAKPVFGVISSDLSVKYPVFKFPPVVNIVKLYVGGGVSHFVSTAILTKDFAEDAITSGIDQDDYTPPASPSEDQIAEDFVDAIVNQFKDEGLQMGIGGHLLVSAKAKVPVVPIAAYIDGKYHFGGNVPSGFERSFLSIQIGAALAF